MPGSFGEIYAFAQLMLIRLAGIHRCVSGSVRGDSEMRGLSEFIVSAQQTAGVFCLDGTSLLQRRYASLSQRDGSCSRAAML